MTRPLRIKRVYEPPADDDGARVLVDRLWPRGRSKEDMRLDAWLKDLAPSADLRTWFGHDPARWKDFVKRYRAELAKRPEAGAALKKLRAMWRRRAVTLLYAARDQEHNNAAALASLLNAESL